MVPFGSRATIILTVVLFAIRRSQRRAGVADLTIIETARSWRLAVAGAFLCSGGAVEILAGVCLGVIRAVISDRLTARVGRRLGTPFAFRCRTS
jgi:hypothetical protein